MRRVAPQLTKAAGEVVAQIDVIEVGEPIRARAASLDPATARSLDALHLATAVEIGDVLDSVITYDTRMADAAASLGLEVIAPS